MAGCEACKQLKVLGVNWWGQDRKVHNVNYRTHTHTPHEKMFLLNISLKSNYD